MNGHPRDVDSEIFEAAVELCGWTKDPGYEDEVPSFPMNKWVKIDGGERTEYTVRVEPGTKKIFFGVLIEWIHRMGIPQQTFYAAVDLAERQRAERLAKEKTATSKANGRR